MLRLQTESAPSFNRANEIRRSEPAKSGSVLVEFAFVSLVFYFLLAGTIEMGRALHGSQALQNAARVCARELAVMPMPATITFREALGLEDMASLSPEELAAAARVRNEIYDRGRLVLDVEGLSGQSYTDRLATLPLVNRMLVPLMIRERIDIGESGERDVLRFPGAIFAGTNNGAPGEMGYYVRIPNIVSRGANGAESIEWVDVLEEIEESPGVGPFSIMSTGTHQGLVAVRMNYPFQAATLSAYSTTAGATNEVITADDGSVTGGGGSPLSFTSTTVGTYSGQYGLGSQEALTKKVRPFRRLLTAQSIFRREVFQ